jgi:hypothetical protein
VALREGAIFADLSDVPPGDTEVVLHTPNPPIPAELGNNADRRELGLALPVEARSYQAPEMMTLPSFRAPGIARGVGGAAARQTKTQYQRPDTGRSVRD